VHVQVLADVLDGGADFADAIAAPRWRLDVDSWRVTIESRVDEAVVTGLRSRGHEVVEARAFDSGMGHAHATWRSAEGYGVTFDPRSEGAALGL
jgi:gamma-glutamyltranspeptidase